MHIGAVAEQTELSLRTLRHYDEVGLVRPNGRTSGGFRLYTPDDVERLLLIRRMKPLGFSLEEMRELLHLIDAEDKAPTEEKRRSLEEFIADARSRRDKLASRLAMADELIERLQSEAQGRAS